MKFDMHMHTHIYSGCSRMSPEELLEAVQARGLDGAVITEHDIMWPKDDFAALQARVPDMALLNAVEQSCDEGHFLCYGVTDYAPLQDLREVARVIEIVHRQGGVVVVAHPYRENLAAHDILLGLPLDGVEVDSLNTTAQTGPLAAKLAQRMDLPALVNSDAHRREDVGAFHTEFDAKIGSMADLVQAIRAGRIAGHGGPALEARRQAAAGS